MKATSRPPARRARTIYTRVSDHLWEWLDRSASDLSITKSSLMAMILSERMASRRPITLSPRGQNKKARR